MNTVKPPRKILTQHPFEICIGCLGKPYACSIQLNYINGFISSDNLCDCPCTECIVKVTCDDLCEDIGKYLMNLHLSNVTEYDIVGSYHVFNTKRDSLLGNLQKSIDAHMRK